MFFSVIASLPFPVGHCWREAFSKSKPSWWNGCLDHFLMRTVIYYYLGCINNVAKTVYPFEIQ